MEFKKEYVKSMKLAAHLMLAGFRILEVRKDRFNPSFDVYVFKSSEELTKEMMKFIEENGGNKNGIINKNCKNTTKGFTN